MNISKFNSRKRRSRKARGIQRKHGMVRLCVSKSSRHISASIIISGDCDKTLVTVSTKSAALKSALKYTGNIEAAEKVGAAIAEAALKKGVQKVAFDRSGFLYHGRVKALAEKAREAGLQF